MGKQGGDRKRDQESATDPLDEALGLSEQGLRRSDFLSGAGKLGLGALALGGLGGLPQAAWGSARAAGSRAKTLAVIENAFGSFATDNQEKPIRAYLSKSAPGWHATFGNENNVLPTGVQLFNQYAAANDAALILISAQAMTGYEQVARSFTKAGGVVICHGTASLGPATQNVCFSHKQAGVGIGKAAIAWAHKNNITAPVVALIGLLSAALPKERTTWAWKTIKAAFPNAQLVGEVEGIDQPTGATAAANLLSAHPNINIMIAFDGPAGLGALASAHQAGKNDPKSFYLACTDQEAQTLQLIAAGNSILQANYGVFFPADFVLCARDCIAAAAGKKIHPTRLLYGLVIDTPAEAKSFNTIAFDPLNPKYAYVYTKYFKYLDTPLATNQAAPGQ